jgi:hypothetical protein
MSFLEGILSIGRTVVGAISGSTIASSIVKIAALSYISRKINSNANKKNDTDNKANIDQGVRLQIPPAADNKIPVLYGEAYFGGIITDAVMTNSNKTMYYCLTLSERTGSLLSSGTSSTYTFKNVYWNDQRIIFKSDGITVDYTMDRTGTIDRSLDGQVSIYCYAGNSNSRINPVGYTNTATLTAYTVMPNWSTSTHQMNDLIFSIVKVDYNKEKNVTGLGTVLFQIDNSLKKPGDVLYDYMVSTRYGAGIAAAEVLT